MIKHLYILNSCVQVSKERKWKEIMLAFNTSSATEASLLRRIYTRTLQLYEQVYLLGATGRIVQRPGNMFVYHLSMTDNIIEP